VSWWKTSHAWWAGLSTKAKAGLVGGVIVAGVIANAIEPEPSVTRVPEHVEPLTPEVPETPPPAPSNAWSDDHGNSFSVTSSEPTTFEGTGSLGGLRGPATIEGELKQGFWAVTVVDSDGTTQREGRGGLVDQGHFNYTWRDARGAVTNGQFHINHAH